MLKSVTWGYEKHDPAGDNSGNSRNGTTTKKLKGEFGEIDLETPRDRNGSFEPAMVSKGQSRFSGFDDKIISMYSRGMTTREIEGHLKEIYGVEVSPTLISNVTEAVMEEVKVWQDRPLDEVKLWKAWKNNTRLSTASWESPPTGDSHIFTVPAAVACTHRRKA